MPRRTTGFPASLHSWVPITWSQPFWETPPWTVRSGWGTGRGSEGWGGAADWERRAFRKSTQASARLRELRGRKFPAPSPDTIPAA